MKIIGLCGGSGSGKGTVANLFLKHGIRAIDTDAVYHKLVSERSACTEELVLEFGEDILTENGSLDRKKLSSIVFDSANSAAKLKKLNGIAHKHILAECKKIISGLDERRVKAVLIDAPLLFESGFNKECDKIIAVTADREIRVDRIIKRDNISKKDAFLRINTQLPDDYLISNSDFIIKNNGSVSELVSSVDDVAKQILNN